MPGTQTLLPRKKEPVQHTKEEMEIKYMKNLLKSVRFIH